MVVILRALSSFSKAIYGIFHLYNEHLNYFYLEVLKVRKSGQGESTWSQNVHYLDKDKGISSQDNPEGHSKVIDIFLPVFHDVTFD